MYQKNAQLKCYRTSWKVSSLENSLTSYSDHRICTQWTRRRWFLRSLRTARSWNWTTQVCKSCLTSWLWASSIKFNLRCNLKNFTKLLLSISMCWKPWFRARAHLKMWSIRSLGLLRCARRWMLMTGKLSDSSCLNFLRTAISKSVSSFKIRFRALTVLFTLIFVALARNTQSDLARSISMALMRGRRQLTFCTVKTGYHTLIPAIALRQSHVRT